jgi:hypothetical protein
VTAPVHPIDWQGLFRDPASAPVEGVRLGDAVETLPFARFTAVEPRADGVHRVWRGGEAFDVADDGSERAVTRAQLDEELRRDGGSAWIEQIGFDVADGRVRKIWVRGDGALAGAPFAAEGDIARLLGKPTGIERILGWRVHHYAERGLSVGWDPKRARVEHVALGPVDWTPRRLGRADVLYTWLDAALMLPSWDEPADRASSAWVRWARVNALLRAFELGTPSSFESGAFLDGHKIERYPRVAEVIASVAEPSLPARPVWMFRWLLHYRTMTERILRSGWVEAGDRALLAAIDLTDGANRALGAALEPIEALLVELISPDERAFDEAELVARFGWPDVDLQSIVDDEENV